MNEDVETTVPLENGPGDLCVLNFDGSGVRPVRLPSRSPNLNAYAERFVRSIKSECLAQVIPIGEGRSVPNLDRHPSSMIPRA